MLSVSSFLKNEYDINGIIFPKITYTKENDQENLHFIFVFEYMALLLYNIYILFIMVGVVIEKKMV